MTDEKFKQWQIDTAKKRAKRIRDYLIPTSLDIAEAREWIKEYIKLETFLRDCN